MSCVNIDMDGWLGARLGSMTLVYYNNYTWMTTACLPCCLCYPGLLCIPPPQSHVTSMIHVGLLLRIQKLAS